MEKLHIEKRTATRAIEATTLPANNLCFSMPVFQRNNTDRELCLRLEVHSNHSLSSRHPELGRKISPLLGLPTSYRNPRSPRINQPVPVVVVSGAVVVVTVEESVEASPEEAVVWSAGGAAGVVVAELAGASVASLPEVAGGASVGPAGSAVEPPEKVVFFWGKC